MEPITKTLMYVGPFAAGVGIETGQWLERNTPTDVDAELAGRAPDAGDPGEGLLAQTANFIEADMGASTVAKVLEGVGDDPDRAAAALALEQTKGDKARTTLITELEAIIAAGTGDEDA